MKVYNEFLRSVANFWDHPPLSHQILYRWKEFPLDKLRGVVQIIVKQQRPWVVGFPRWLGNIYGNCPVVEVRRLLLEDMTDEDFEDKLGRDGHVGLQRRLALALGLADRDLEEGPFVSEVLAVCYTMEHMSKTRPWLEAIACVMGTELLTVGRVPRIYEDMEEYDSGKGGVAGPQLDIYKALGLSKEDIAFYWAHDVSRLSEYEGREASGPLAGTEIKHMSHVIRALTDYARTPEEQKKVVEMVRLGHRLYGLRWDGVGRAVQEYLETGSSPWGGLLSKEPIEHGQRS